MRSEAEGRRSADATAVDRDSALRKIARTLRIPTPNFDGPLVAFQPDGRRGPGDPVYLGGDLHAVHPRAAEPSGPRDPSLERSTIILTDFEHESLRVTSTSGIWCVPIQGGWLATMPYLSLFDADGHLRAWRLLPKARMMIGIAHFWLPSVPPPGDPAGRGNRHPTDPLRP
jgi:hypothetical protein